MNQRILFHLAWGDRRQPSVNLARCTDQNLQYNSKVCGMKFHKRKVNGLMDKHLRSEHQKFFKSLAAMRPSVILSILLVDCDTSELVDL